MDIGKARESANEAISKLRPPENGAWYENNFITRANASASRAVLGFANDTVLGLAQMVQENAHKMPIIPGANVYGTGVEAAQQLNEYRIQQENLRLGNTTQEEISAQGKQQLAAMWDGLVEPITKPWNRGDYLEAVARGGLEVGSLLVGVGEATAATKGARAANAANKAAVATRAAETATVLKQTAKGADVAQGTVTALNAGDKMVDASKVAKTADKTNDAAKTGNKAGDVAKKDLETPQGFKEMTPQELQNVRGGGPGTPNTEGLKPVGFSTKSAADATVPKPTTHAAQDIRFSQNTVSYQKRDGLTYDNIVQSMNKNGWKGDPVDVVKMPDGRLTSIDNTRIRAARETGTDVSANVRDFNAPLTSEEMGRFTRRGETPSTWGEAITLRINGQSGKFGVNNPNGLDSLPRITGQPKP